MAALRVICPCNNYRNYSMSITSLSARCASLVNVFCYSDGSDMIFHIFILWRVPLCPFLPLLSLRRKLLQFALSVFLYSLPPSYPITLPLTLPPSLPPPSPPPGHCSFCPTLLHGPESYRMVLLSVRRFSRIPTVPQSTVQGLAAQCCESSYIQV